MTLVQPCFAGKTSGCQLLSVQSRILESRGRLTSRLSTNNVDSVELLPHGIIKGLYLLNESCPHGQGMVVFMAVTKVDLQHKDIASAVGLRVVFSDDSYGGDDGGPTGHPRLLAENAWGFTLARREVPQANERLLPAEAMSLWEKNIYGYLFRKKTMGSAWAIMPNSGLTGKMPKDRIPAFLETLAKSASPHFAAYVFHPAYLENMVQRLVEVPLAAVTHPTCLRWPPEQMLVHQLRAAGEDLD